jgi:hypothetical protein
MVLIAHGFRAHGLHVMKDFKRLVILHCNVSELSGEGSLGWGQKVGQLARRLAGFGQGK